MARTTKNKGMLMSNFGSSDSDDGNSKSKGDDEYGWCFQLEGIQTVTDTNCGLRQSTNDETMRDEAMRL